MTRTTTTTIVVTLALAHLAFAPTAWARQPADQPEPQPVVRTYNVADLMRAAADYPLDSQIVPPTGYGAAADARTGAMFGQPAPPAKPNAPLDELITLISNFVDADSWKENGGSIGSMRGFGTLLVVAQSDANHAKITQLLDEIRRNTGPSQIVAVRATWLLMNPADVPAPATVAADDWLAKQAVYCEGRTVCFSG